jgi:hypothetical protein
MTTLWDIKPDWAGETVAVLGSGPSLTLEIAESLTAHRCIAVNHSFLLAPAADMLVALDLDFWTDTKDFSGLRVCGVDSDDVDALYAGPMYERIEIGPGHTVELRNSGLAAIRIAARMGATRIILAGFDPRTRAHFDGHPNAEGPAAGYPALAEGLAGMIAELGEQGIAVEWQTSYALNSEPIESIIEVRDNGVAVALAALPSGRVSTRKLARDA